MSCFEIVYAELIGGLVAVRNVTFETAHGRTHRCCSSRSAATVLPLKGRSPKIACRASAACHAVTSMSSEKVSQQQNNGWCTVVHVGACALARLLGPTMPSDP